MPVGGLMFYRDSFSFFRPLISNLAQRNSNVSDHHTSSVSPHYLVKCQYFTDCAIGQWRRQLECVVQQQGRHIEHLMYKLQDVTVTLDYN